MIDDPELDKKLLNGKHDFTVGDQISYQLITRVPENISNQQYTKFTLTDLPNDYVQIDQDSIAVSFDGQEYSESSGLFELWKNTPETGFTLNFNLDLLHDLKGQELVVTYQAKLLEVPENSIDRELINTATLDWGNGTLTDEEWVVTSGKRFVKKDANDTTKLLANAKFVVKNTDGKYLKQTSGGTSWLTVPETAITSGSYQDYGLTVLTSGSDGTFNIKGLSYGSYQLVEVAAPDGYQLLSQPVSFTVSANSYQLFEGEQRLASAALDVLNDPSGTLPSTGGKVLPSTGEKQLILITLSGILLLGLMLMIARRRENRE